MSAERSVAPRGLSPITPFLAVSDPGAALDFYRRAFGAEEADRTEHDGKVFHATMRIEGAAVELGRHGSRTADGVAELPSVGVHLYVRDVDAVLERATAAGARTMVPIADQPYGDREVTLADPFGVVWYVATHKD